jgi:hypothetical protein
MRGRLAELDDAAMAEMGIADKKDFAHDASFFVACFARFRLALDRQVSEQNRSRFEPQIGVPQDSQDAGLAAIGFWQWGQSFIGTENGTVLEAGQAVLEGRSLGVSPGTRQIVVIIANKESKHVGQFATS